MLICCGIESNMIIKIYGISNAKTFYKACNEQMVAFRTAPAQAEAEVQA